MRIPSLLCAAALLGLATGLLFGRPADPAAELVKQLGDDEFERREAAGRALEALGEKAVPALVEAVATTDDPEVRRRGRRLLVAVMPRAVKSKALGLALVRIDAGDFAMGSPPTELNRRGDEDAHRVRLTRPLYLGTYEVTQDEFRRVTKREPSWFRDKGDGAAKVAGLKTGRFPVETVTWFDAVEFCNELSKLDGLGPCYDLSGVTRKDGSVVTATVKRLPGRGYRLPSEAEWEYACRADSVTPFGTGVRLTRGDANARPMLVASGYGSAPEWAALERTAEVGTHKANGWGLHDMHGNVAEWCGDWYDAGYYAAGPAGDPPGPAKGVQRALRGGSWLVTQPSCRSASRAGQAPGEAGYAVGFRVARNP